MIRVAPGPIPAVLAGPESKGGKERAAAVAFYADKNNSANSFDFRAYKEVGDALAAVFGTKCAYCESEYAQVHPPDIEHYRPKGGYKVGKKLVKPGYYWIAADWLNLLPSCIDCNRMRYHEFPNEGPHQRGKENLFPIKDDKKRAKKPGQEAKEGRLLLHPYFDDPSKHLDFKPDGSIRPRVKGARPSAMGKSSIEVYGLDRPGLCAVRRDRLLKVQGSMEQVRRLLDAYDLVPAGAAKKAIKQALDAEIEHLRDLLLPTQPYSAASAQVVGDFFNRL